MTKTLSLNFFVLLIGFHVGEILSFPDGAPSATCKNHRPSHGANSQPFQTLPFQVEASAEEYKSGDRIAGILKCFVLEFHLFYDALLYSIYSSYK